ncbi:MAG: hypothetical protein JXQ75_02165 [Phycisphaerae bacterium]|nr:hypothetical protein [Phycisphaerae bacterium]
MACQRLILKPDGLTPDDAARLMEHVRAAVQQQMRLASESPHILRFVHQVREEASAFVIEHEPATPLQVADLFNPDAPPANEEQLLDAAAALVDALRVAHDADPSQPLVHGGLCPGAILIDPDGVWKVSDFGFAQAISEVLGPDSYLNLAVGPKSEAKCNSSAPADETTASETTASASGTWEVLTPDECERNDRICAFIDPEKYGAEIAHGPGALASFEAGSDVIAAGFILHLLAEHRHPYLHPYPDAHRVVEMSRMMAAEVPTSARRKDLHASQNEGIRVWCDMVRDMLARLPKNRPSAAELAKRLEPHVTKIDFDEILRRQDRADAEKWLAAVERALEDERWHELEERFAEQPQLKHWPEAVVARADEISRRLKEHQEEQSRLEAIEADRQAAQQWIETLRRAVEAEEWDQAGRVLQDRPDLTHWPAELGQEADGLADRVHAAVKRLQDHQAARGWQAQVAQAVEQEAWKQANELLAARPPLEYWPEDVLDAEPRYADQIGEHIEAIEFDHGRARAWLAEAKEAVRKKSWEQALRILDQPPTDIQHWPEEVGTEADHLKETCRGEFSDGLTGRLLRRTETVRNLAQAYARAVIKKDLAPFLDPALIEVGIMAESFTSDQSFGEGQAQMSLKILEDAATTKAPRSGLPLGGRAKDDAADAVQTPFSYQVETTPPRVFDEKGLVRSRLATQLARLLAKRQRQRIADWQAQLRKGLFPRAEITGEFDKLVPQAAVKIALLGKKTTAGTIDVQIRWDPSELAWVPENAEDYASKAMDIAVRTTHAALDNLVGRSQVLAPYTTALSIHLTPASPAGASTLPDQLALQGRLAMRRDAHADPEVLQDFRFTCTHVGRIPEDVSLVEAESALGRMLLAAQVDVSQALEAELKGRVQAAQAEARAASPSAARVKVKIRKQPKRIKEPVDQVSFELHTKAADTVTLPAHWNPGAFTFEFADGWETTVSGLLGPAVEAMKAKEPQASPRALPSGSPRVEKAARAEAPGSPARKTKRRGLVLTSAAAAAVVLITAAVLTLRSGKDGQADSRPEPVPPRSIPVKLAIDRVGDQSTKKAFAVRVAALDEAGNPAEVSEDTAVTIRAKEGSARLLGNLTGVIRAGEKSVLIEEIICDEPVDGLAIEAVTDGELLASAVSNEFDVIAPQAPPETVTAPESVPASPAEPRSVPVTDQWAADWPDLKGGEIRADAVRSSIEALLPEARPETAAGQIDFLVKVARTVLVNGLKEDGDGGVSFVIDVQPKAGGEPSSEQFTMLRVSESWQAPEVNVAQLAALSADLTRKALASVETAARDMNEYYLAGRLRDAYQEYDQVKDLLTLPPLAGEGAVRQISESKGALPPRWTDRPGYRSGQPDADLQYPKTLTADADGQTLVLVSVPPNDPVWEAIQRAPGRGENDSAAAGRAGRQAHPLQAEAARKPEDRSWRIFYIDTNKIQEAGRFVEAEQIARDRGRRLPNRSEWMLAALKLHDSTYADFGFVGGGWEWCYDETDAGSPWVCGGCSRLGPPYSDRLIPPLPDAVEGEQKADALARLWAWLNDPLVSQQREYGEDLTSFRTILRIHPTPP